MGGHRQARRRPRRARDTARSIRLRIAGVGGEEDPAAATWEQNEGESLACVPYQARRPLWAGGDVLGRWLRARPSGRSVQANHRLADLERAELAGLLPPEEVQPPNVREAGEDLAQCDRRRR